MFPDLLLCLLFQAVTSQYDDKFQQAYIQHPFQSLHYQEYDVNDYNWRRQNRYSNAGRHFPGQSKVKFPEYSDSDIEYFPKETKCRCSCKRCEELKPCCKSVCVNCIDPGLILIPYPVPVIVHVSSAKSETPGDDITSTTITTTTTTTTTSTTIATKPTETSETTGLYQKSTIAVIDPVFTESNVKVYKKCPLTNNNCVHANQFYRRDNIHYNTDEQKKIYRDLGVIRPTVPNRNYGIKNRQSNWIPKYGIMPIPNDIALKLMEDLD